MSISKQNRKVLITGGAGFIGANFVYKFLEMGYSVNIFEIKEADLWRLEKALKNPKNSKKIEIHSPNLLNYNETEKIIKKIKPDIVLHFAAYGAYQNFQQEISATVDANIKTTINLADACQKADVKCFINTGSSSEYGIKEKPMKETDILEPDNLYGITKSAGTFYCQMLAKKSGFPCATIRPFAVYGYFEEKKRLVPTIINSCLKNNELKLSNPESVRDFIFIEDLISGYLSAVKNIDRIKGEIFNLGTGKQNKIRDVVKIVKKITESMAEPAYGQIKIVQTEPKKWEADISKAKKLLEWRPKYNLEEGLKKNINWFKSNLNLYEN